MLTEHKYTTGYCFLQQICHLQSLDIHLLDMRVTYGDLKI